MDEALAWAKRIPALGPDTTPGTVELRPLFEADDFGEEFTPELKAQEDRLRKQIAGS